MVDQNILATNPNENWRNYTRQSSIAACKLSRADLKTLYRLIQDKQTAALNLLLPHLFQTPEETPEQFQARQTNVRNAFITTVVIKGSNGEVVTANSEATLDNLPDRIESVLYDTSFSPNAILNFTPANRASVLLDFSQPQLMEFNAHPSAPTANNSNWFVSGENEDWSTSFSTKLKEFFGDRSSPIDWLHWPATYDKLLMLGGAPLAIWGAFRLGGLFTGSLLPPVLETGIYIYAFLFCGNIFRSMFSYARWIFPKVELTSERSSMLRHRTIWSSLALGIVGKALYDGITLLLK